MGVVVVWLCFLLEVDVFVSVCWFFLKLVCVMILMSIGVMDCNGVKYLKISLYGYWVEFDVIFVGINECVCLMCIVEY